MFNGFHHTRTCGRERSATRSRCDQFKQGATTAQETRKTTRSRGPFLNHLVTDANEASLHPQKIRHRTWAWRATSSREAG